MRKVFIGILVVISGMAAVSVSAFQDRYLTHDNFGLIVDKHERARHFAVCAAIFEVAAVVHENLFDQPAQGKQMRELSYGAKVAVSMTFVSDMGDLNRDGIKERFKATWDFAKLMAETMPATVATVLEADMSKATDEDSLMNVLKPIFETATICMNNLKFQQVMIDLWRELAMSGLVTSPPK